KRLPEREVLLHRQGRLEGVAVAEVVRLLGQGRIRGPASQLQAALGRFQEPGDQAQKCGLSGAIAARDGKHLAAGDGKIDPLEHLAAAPHAAKVLSRQANHHCPPLVTARARGSERLLEPLSGASIREFARAMFRTQVDVADGGKSPYKRAY